MTRFERSRDETMTSEDALTPMSSNRFGLPRLFRDATALASSSVANAAFGMASWAMTARLIPPAELGVMTAVLAAITTPAVAVAGMIGDAYGSLLPAVGLSRPHVYRLGQRLFLLLSLATGTVAGIGCIVVVPEVRGSIEILLMTVAGTVMVGAYMVRSAALSALGRANWLFTATVGMNSLRLILLYCFAVTFAWHSFELSIILACGAVAVVLTRRTRQIVMSSDALPMTSRLSLDESLSGFKRYVAQAAVSTTLGYAIFSLTPFLIAAFSSPTQTALFALALPLAQTLDLVSVAMGTSLLIHGSADPDEAGGMARSVLIRSVAVVSVGGVAITAFAPWALGHLNHAYENMNPTAVIAALCGASLLRTPFTVWSALQRSRRRQKPVLVAASVGAVVTVAAVSILSTRHGAFGGALGVAAGYTALSLCAAVHAILGGRVRRASWSGVDVTENA